MYIFPEKETATGMGTLPVFGTLLAVIFIGLFTFSITKSKDELEQQKHVKLLKLIDLIQTEKYMGRLPQVLAEDLARNPYLLDDPEISREVSLKLQLAYKEYKEVKTLNQIVFKRQNAVSIINGFFNLSIIHFFWCLIFFYLAAYLLEHVFNPFIFFISFLIILSAWFGVHMDQKWTWEIPLNSIFPGIVLSLWLLVLRMAFNSHLVVAIGIWPIKSLCGKLNLSFVLLFLVFSLGLVADTYLNHQMKTMKYPVYLALLTGLAASFLPFVTGNRISREEKKEWRVIGKSLNQVEDALQKGEHEFAKKKIRKLNTPKLNYEQSGRLAEFAWSLGMMDVVSNCYNRQLLKMDGGETDKEHLLKKMLQRGVKIPSVHFEKLFKKAVKTSDSALLRIVFPHLSTQNPKTMEHIKVTLRERIKRAIKNDEDLFLQDMLQNLKGITAFSSLTAGIERYLIERTKKNVYVDNYVRNVNISNFININLAEIKTSHIVMELSNGSMQKVPWMAVKGILGFMIQSTPVGVIFVEFKKKLFACQFEQSRFIAELAEWSFTDVWERLRSQAPEDLKVSEYAKFETILKSQIQTTCEAFLEIS